MQASRVYLYSDKAMGMMAQGVDKRSKPAPTVQGRNAEEQMQFIINLSILDWEDMTSIVHAEDCKVSGVQGADLGF